MCLTLTRNEGSIVAWQPIAMANYRTYSHLENISWENYNTLMAALYKGHATKFYPSSKGAGEYEKGCNGSIPNEGKLANAPPNTEEREKGYNGPILNEVEHTTAARAGGRQHTIVWPPTASLWTRSEDRPDRKLGGGGW